MSLSYEESEFTERTVPTKEQVNQERQQMGIARVCDVPECIRVARVECDVCNTVVCKEHISFDEIGVAVCELCDAERSA